MKKSKIAISLDKALLDKIDANVDGSIMRSRSQAIEFFLKKGLQEHTITTAVILIKGDQQSCLLKKINGKSLLKNQLELFRRYGITSIFLITQHTKSMNDLLEEASNTETSIEIIEKESRGNAQALSAIRQRIQNSFIVISGDTYNNFDLGKMIKKHLSQDKLATMGLMTRDKPSFYGTAILDGDFIIDFKEKPKDYSTHIVNAGIYIFRPEIFEFFDNAVSLEKDIFPKLARIRQLIGFFTYGEYIHVEG